MIKMKLHWIITILFARETLLDLSQQFFKHLLTKYKQKNNDNTKKNNNNLQSYLEPLSIFTKLTSVWFQLGYSL